MKQKIIGYISALVILSASFMAMKALISSKEEAKRKESPEVVRSVRVFEYMPEDLNVSISITGKLKAYNRIEIFSEVGGRVLSNNGKFRKGNSYTRGQVLLRMDDTDMRASIIALKTSFQSLITQILPDIKLDYTQSFDAWQKYLANFDPEKPIPALPKPANTKEKQFLTIKNVFNQFYNIRSQEEKLDKYTIRAPFSGTLSASTVQQGSIIRPGQKLGEFIQPGNFELEVPVNVKDIQYLQVGQTVNLRSEDIDGEWIGKLQRIGKSIDPQTQSISAFLEIKSNDLKEGMFLVGEIQGEKLKNCYEIPRKLLLQDRTIFLVEDGKLKSVKPKILRVNESSVIISGLKEGAKILRESFVGAYNGMPVKVVG